MMKVLGVIISVVILSSATALAKSPRPNLDYMNTKPMFEKIDSWLSHKIVAISIAANNQKYGNLTEEQVVALDTKWRNENKQDDKPLIAATLSSPLSSYLTRMQGQSYGLFVEVFVMDKKGLNVGQSSITSDFWQGDEAKFQKTFQVGPDALFIDEPEWDEEHGIWRVQVNKSLVDPDSKELIGAATVEVNLTELARRQRFMR